MYNTPECTEKWHSQEVKKIYNYFPRQGVIWSVLVAMIPFMQTSLGPDT